MRSTIFYRLFEAEKEQLIWLFCEWDSLIPQNISDLLWGKPVYLCSTTQVPPVWEFRQKDGRNWVDLKWVVQDGSKIRQKYDVDIIESLDKDFGVVSLQKNPIITGVVGIAPEKMLYEVQSHDNSFIKSQNMAETRRRLSSILEVETECIGFIGSQTIGLEREKGSDLDIVVNLPLSAMQSFVGRIWKIKRAARYLQKEKAGLHFPFKIILQDSALGQLEVDVFPKTLDIENHLLAGSKEWSIINPKQKKVLHITDTTLGYEGWPVLFSDDGTPIIILSNAFKGIFKPGDVITAYSLIIRIDYGDHMLHAFVINDPFRDIESATAYFKFREN